MIKLYLKRTSKVFAEFDVDGSGAIDWEEFKAMLMQVGPRFLLVGQPLDEVPDDTFMSGLTTVLSAHLTKPSSTYIIISYQEEPSVLAT